MARQNRAFLYGRVQKAPVFKKNADGELVHGMCYIQVVRGVREDKDASYMKYDKPLLMSMEKHILERMATWEVNDIVLIKGMLVTKKIRKSSKCPNCVDENGNPTKNSVEGNIVYINPIHVMKIKSYGAEDEGKRLAVQDVVENKEISNQMFIYGTLVHEPQLYKLKSKLAVSQYQIAINRDFFIKTDDPTIKADYPYVKTYGKQATEDKMRLQQSSQVIIDGYIQARSVKRATTCCKCNQEYRWLDRCMEIVPFEVEYVKGTYKSDEDLVAEQDKEVEEIRKQIFGSAVDPEMLDSEEISVENE